MKSLMLVIALAGCNEMPLPTPPLPPPVVEAPAPPPAPLPPPVPKPVASVAQDYRRAVQKEKRTVLSDDATVDSVRAAHEADLEAQAAMRVIEGQGHHPTPAALKAARDAVARLLDVLNASP